MLLKIKYIVVILFFAISCNSEKNTNDITSDFDKIEKLNPIQVYDIEMYNTVKILVRDSLLITQENTTKDFFYNAYNLNNGDKVASFLSFGHGNNETTQAFNVSNYSGDTIQVYSNPNSVALFSITDILNGNVLPVIKTDLIKTNIEPFVSMHLISDNDYITCAEDIKIDNNARFCRYNHESKQMKYFGKYPDGDLKLKEIPIENCYRLYAYQGDFHIRQDKNRAVFARSYGIGFDIVDLVDNKIITSKTYKYPDYYLEHISQFDMNMVKMTDEDISLTASACSEECFYLAYNRIEMTDNGAKRNANGTVSYIFCFDWDGKPVKGYVVDEVIESLGIDSKQGFLYCVTVNEDKNQSLKKYYCCPSKYD